MVVMMLVMVMAVMVVMMLVMVMAVMVMAVMVVPAFWYLKQSNATATVFLVYILYKQFKTLYKGPFYKTKHIDPGAWDPVKMIENVSPPQSASLKLESHFAN